MAEYIERQEVYSEINKLPLTEDATMEILWAIDHIPTADVAPVVHGYWKPIYPDIDHQDRAKDYECSVCRRISSDEVYSRSLDFEFCPYCGAKMDKCSPSMDYLTLLRRENEYGR